MQKDLYLFLILVISFALTRQIITGKQEDISPSYIYFSSILSLSQKDNSPSISVSHPYYIFLSHQTN